MNRRTVVFIPAGVALLAGLTANFAHLSETGLHFVGSLPPSDFPDLLNLPARRRRPVDVEKFPGLSAYDTRTGVFGTDRRVVLTHSETLHAAQAAGFTQTLAKATRALGELAATLARGKTRRDRPAVQAARRPTPRASNWALWAPHGAGCSGRGTSPGST